MIDEAVCCDWEAWKGWGPLHGGEGGGEPEEKFTGPWVWRGTWHGEGPASLPFLLGSRVKARTPARA